MSNIKKTKKTIKTTKTIKIKKTIKKTNTKIITFNKLVNKLKNKPLFMMIGHGSKNQIKDLRKFKSILNKISNTIPKNSNMIYFGDETNIKSRNIGFGFKYLNDIRPDINFYLIQINKFNKYGSPDFVKGEYWHDDWIEKCMFGPITTHNNPKPCSNTLKWINLHKDLINKTKQGITKIFVLGGGNITNNEIKLALKLKIPVEYFEVERKYLGDKKTLTKSTMSKKSKIGDTYKYKYLLKKL
jgi:hypothetical protein